jgi:preprotein translocase SecE subunit
MAEASKQPRRIKKSESIRERAEKAANTEPKPRRIRRTAGVASTPFKAFGRLLARIFRPLAFILIPFKTRPMRFIGRILASVLLLRFFRDAWRELREVQWPSVRDTARLSFAVFAFSVVFGLIIAVTDYGLDKVFKKLLLQ